MFQSTHSLRSATPIIKPFFILCQVSIHALLAECDSRSACSRQTSKGFNPRTPCGVRRESGEAWTSTLPFQSTHSLRSATLSRSEMESTQTVSIHALLAECDAEARRPLPLKHCFNPRTPCGVRLRLTIYIVIQQRKRYFAPTSRRRPSSPSLLF